MRVTRKHRRRSNSGLDLFSSQTPNCIVRFRHYLDLKSTRLSLPLPPLPPPPPPSSRLILAFFSLLKSHFSRPPRASVDNRYHSSSTLTKLENTEDTDNAGTAEINMNANGKASLVKRPQLLGYLRSRQLGKESTFNDK